MFYFSKCTQPCSQSALHFLLFSFLWFTDKNTWGKKKAQYQIPGGSDLPQEKNVARCITGARCPGWEREAQWMGQSALSSVAVVPRASQVLSQPRRWRVTLSSSSVIDPCRSSEESKRVFLCRAILQPKKKSSQELQSLLLPDQDLSSSWRKNREMHFCSHFHPQGS